MTKISAWTGPSTSKPEGRFVTAGSYPRTLHLPYSPQSVWITRRAPEWPSEPFARDRAYLVSTPAGRPIPRRRHLPLDCPRAQGGLTMAPRHDRDSRSLRTVVATVAAALLAAVIVAPALAAPPGPSSIALPNGWAPA